MYQIMVVNVEDITVIGVCIVLVYIHFVIVNKKVVEETVTIFVLQVPHIKVEIYLNEVVDNFTV